MRSFILITTVVLNVLLFTNCSNNTAVTEETYISPDELYTRATELEGEALSNELYAMPFFKGFLTPDGFLGYIRADNGKLVHLFDSSNAELKASEGTKGRGSNELLLAHAVDYNPKTGSLFLHDIIRSVAVQFRYEDNKIVNKGPVILAQRAKGCVTEELQAISDSVFVLRVNDIAPPYGGYLAVVNSNNETLDSLQIYQVDDDRVKHSKIRIIDASIRLSPDRNTLVVCNSKYNHLTLYGVENNSLKKLRRRTVIEPVYTVKKGNIIRAGKHVEWRGTVFMSDKYIYVVSNPETRGDYLKRLDKAQKSGETMGELMENSYILVFDYNLDFIKSYKCDDHFKWISISPDGRTVYASVYRDGCNLRRYNLQGLDY